MTKKAPAGVIDELDELARKMRPILFPENDCPKDAMTAFQWAKLYEISRDAMDKRLKVAAQDGKMNTGVAYRRTPDGRYVRQRLYWPTT